MKILKVNFNNINSLKGETLIDFTVEPFLSDPIFAIIGDTGSGKTTIFDAICVALYHQTPRKVELDSIITNGCTNLSSSVEFEVKGVRYRAFYSKTISKGKSKDVAELINVTNEKIITDRVRDKLKYVNEIIGLNYNQFCRSVLLAQGEFASFIKSSYQEKSELLEQLTENKVYEDISKKVFEKEKIIKNEISLYQSQIDVIKCLSIDEFEQLKIEQSELIESTTKLKEKNVEYKKILSWYDNYKKLSQSKIDLLKVQNLLNQESLLKKDDINKLDLATRAKELAPHLDNLKFYEANKLNLSEKISDAKKSKEILALKIKEIEERLLETSTELTNFENKRAPFILKLNDKLIPLELSLVNDKNRLQKDKEKLSKNKSELESKNSTLLKLKTEYKSLNDEKEQILKDGKFDSTKYEIDLNKWQFMQKEFRKNDLELRTQKENLLNATSKETVLKRDLTLIEDEIKLLEKNKKDLDDKFNRLNIQKQDLVKKAHQNAFIVNIENLIEDLNGYSKRCIDDLKEAFEYKSKHFIFKEESKEAFELKEKLNSIKLTYDDEVKTRNEIKAALQDLDKDLIDAESKAQKEKLAIELEAQREALQSGEPCPLCGATEHILANIDSFKGDLAVAFYNTLIDKQNEFKVNLERLNIAVHENEMKHIKERLDLIKISTDLFEQLPKPSFSYEDLESKRRELDEYIKVATEYAKDEKDLTAKLSEYNLTYNNKTNSRKNIEKEINSLAINIEKVKCEISNLEKMNIDADEEFKDSLNFWSPKNSYNLSLIDEWIKDITDLYDKSQQSSEKLKEINKKIEELNLSIIQKNADIQSETKELVELEKYCEEAALEIEKNSKALTTYFEDYSCFGDNFQSTADIKSAIDARFDALKGKEKGINDERTESLLVLNKIDGSLNETEKSLEIESKRFESALKEWDAKLELSKFECIDDVKRNLLEDFDYEELKNSIDLFFNKKKELDFKVTYNQEQLDKEMQSKPDGIDLNVDYNQLIKEQDEAINELQIKQGENSNKILQNNEALAQKQKIEDSKKQLYSEHEDWKLLNLLIGSADGKKYSSFAQGLTFRQIIILANKQLQVLYGMRYDLQVGDYVTPSKSLDLQIIDHYQADSVREINTLSGGEIFLVSLSLALALAEFASSGRTIDTLFIDEGFGVLDSETLEIVLNSFDNINAQGKMIGVISHLDAIKDRFANKIEVKKHAGFGTSEVIINPR